MKPDNRNWKERFLKVIPMVETDVDGNPIMDKPIQQDPPLNKKGFWVKPETTSSLLQDNIKKVNEQINKHKKQRKK